VLRIDNKRDPSGEVHVGQTFTGRFKPGRADKGDHVRNFQRAFENALEIADSPKVVRDRKRMKLRSTFDATVVFEATIKIASPGDVGEYRVIVTER
jgi:hypothetical protein